MAYATLATSKSPEELLCFIVQRVREHRQPELQTLERDVSNWNPLSRPFPP